MRNPKLLQPVAVLKFTTERKPNLVRRYSHGSVLGGPFWIKFYVKIK
jgi:hypothetical protein